jgi:UDP-glucuronate decarboxylase
VQKRVHTLGCTPFSIYHRQPEGYAMPLSKQKRILVTGGAGLIGSSLCTRLVAEGHDVVCLDNFSTGSKSNIYDLLGEPGFEVIRRDVTLPVSLEVDEIYHLACPSQSSHHTVKPAETIEMCVMGCISMLELARRVNAKILYTSSGQIYWKPEALLRTDGRGKTSVYPDPGVFYREGNRCAEMLFFGYHQQYQLNIRIARLFNTFGPGIQSHPGSVVAGFITRALKGEDLTVYGDGSQTRPFCFVDDIIEALLRLMNAPDDFIGPVDLGNPSEISIFDLAEAVIRLSGSRSGITFEPLPDQEPPALRPDTRLAQRRLKWQPQTDITTGLERTIEYFRLFDVI